MPPSAPPRIFVSHSHTDEAFTERLVDDFNQAGARAWMDKRDLGPGNFQERISEALADCEWFVLVLTRDALASPWVRQEVDAANRLKNLKRIRDLIFIQAGPVTHAEVPALWGVYNILDATTDYASALNRTLKAVGCVPKPSYPLPTVPARLADLGLHGVNPLGTPAILPPMLTVAAGRFRMGSDKARDKEAYDDETPQEWVEVAPFQIAKYPVTVAEYRLFLTASHHAAPASSYNKLTWEQQVRERLDHPVVNVSWQDATAYIAWLREVTGQRGWRLPSEAQWEKAARWDAAHNVSRIYPWGDSFDKNRCNTSESDIKTTTPIGSHPASDQRRSGASPYGAEDMAGNVWEWTSSLFKPYPYTESDGREDQKSTGNRSLRGGSWYLTAGVARAAFRSYDRWGDLGVWGFRLAFAPSAGS